ncbi:hypothetical protein DFQ28_009640 [Apophysomyces sp. BC1034]|nr:hypothetical protein DFQ30_009387 [Apophysomyces sp. BC1015]KAG0172477.1 hypothetical protein DFQ29_008346 [Apophysomyces sp. BC1021]KAG0185251.1 hypothetical protein DFQ28_009640 [Apophysomyces sp. BC1034]
MSTPLFARTALLARAAIRPTAWSTSTRCFASQNKDVVRADQESIVNIDALSGAPEELVLERSVRIYQPAKTATQSGKHGTRHWRIDFDIMEDGNRWENPLMGWASSSDYQQALTVKFKTKEDAITFAEKSGWNYYVQEPKQVKFVKKAYADNYKYSAGKLRFINTK